MGNFKVNRFTPFIPARDFELSRRFYLDFGFNEAARIDKAILLEIEGHGFWLQDYYVEDWANNCMLCLYVEDLSVWNQRLSSIDWENIYGSSAGILRAPHEQEGAMMMQVGDPSGILWHIRQSL